MKNVTVYIVIFMTIFTLDVFSQNRTDQQALIEMAERKADVYQKLKAEAIEFARENDIPVTFEADGRFYELQYILDGIPQYYVTDNANAAISISTNKVYPGGVAGLSLTGTGITPREWDAGAVLTTHQEFGGRVVMGDGASATHYHSTHVAGTIMAAGVVPSAKGMAYAANLRAFDWNNDDSEMASEAAAADGSLMSNHSYGFGRGWVWNGSSWTWYGNSSISTTEDYLFGFYDSYSQAWDQIAYNAPYYLICKSAGNDRGDGPGTSPPNDGPYDCIGQQGVAKNLLTVAAVNDVSGGYSGPGSVVMSSFSSWGPADDGRIKPDISANGVSLYSTYNTNNTSYASLSGTSMSTPSVTGSLAILQEHYENLNGTGNFMTAATTKALIIHTADECGTSDGPDYEFGWGLMNTRSAAAKITEDQSGDVISELILANGGTYTRDVQALGTEPLKVTIVWTDVPGTPVSPQLDPITPMLVNDLDLRLTNGGSTYYPWKLNRNSPASAATNTGENNVDNVEVVYIANPVAGTYTITVDHDGVLTNSPQAFSMIISGIDLQQPPVADFIASPVAPAISETVSFTDQSANNPTSWSWSFSGPGNVTYTGGTNANSQNPQVQFDASGDYSVTLLATNSYGSDTETKINYITVVNCSYCTTNFSNTSDDYISNVTFNTINNNSGTSNYSDFTAISTDVTPGNTYSISADITVNGPWVQHCWVWFDWNGDCDLDDPGEGFDLGETPGTSGVHTLSTTVTIPAGAISGTTRMRISETYSTNPTPCISSVYGEAEDYSVNIIGHVILDLKAFLEGPFNGTNMDAGIVPYLPLSQPFNIPPWNYTGTESVGAIPNPNVVDWVLVDVRDAASAATATGSTSVAKHAAFILNDGSIVDLDGSSNLLFDVSISQNLFVVVWQRNHLGIISNDPLTSAGGIYSYDYTSGINQVFGGIDGHKQISIGIWGMIGGDGNHDGQVDSNDKSPLWENQAGENGYLFGDHNLDGEANNQDKDDIWVPNEGKSSQVPN